MISSNNLVLLVDSHKDADQIWKQKSDALIEIFKNTTDEDFLSMITISRKVKVVFSISKKSKNTTQLSNQLSNIIWEETPRWNFLKGMVTAINELTSFQTTNSSSYIIWVTSSSDLKSFERYKREEIALLQESLSKNKTQLIYIFIGENEDKFDQLAKYIKILREDSIFMTNPSSKEIKEVIQSISWVQLLNEDLIFEKFE